MKAFPGRLNLFQATMLDWRDVHPYNAVHAVRVERALDIAAATDAIAAELTRAGLTGLELDRKRCRYAWRGGAPSVSLETIDAGQDWQRTLEATFERQLNASFAADGAMNPFRFFVMPVDDRFFLGLAYDHFVAGGDSIIVLLNAIVDRYTGRAHDDPPLRLYPRTHARLFVREPWRFLRGITRFPALAKSCRRTIRPRYRDAGDAHNAFTLLELDGATYGALRNAAKAWGVTLNDAVLALLLLAQDAILPDRDMRKRRRELAVASIINLRAAHGEDPRGTFGQFLSSFRVSHPVPEGIALRELAGDVHRATTRIKREKLYLVTLFAMAVHRGLGRFGTPQERMQSYAKSYPVGAGVSSLNVDASWRRGANLPAPLYIRGVPTGPLSPIVVAVTTAGERMHLGVSYRTAAFTADQISGIGRHILERIHSLSP